MDLIQAKGIFVLVGQWLISGFCVPMKRFLYIGKGCFIFATVHVLRSL